ncbi:MAG: hypothetical protein IT215_09005, partial [Chitinophagaceae bacterium]|nr:hypothetical protein [Chitinophagaceae bacterium]
MENISRIFDIIYNYENQFPNKGIFHDKVNDRWRKLLPIEVIEKANQLAASFMRLQMSGNSFKPETQDKVAIIS